MSGGLWGFFNWGYKINSKLVDSHHRSCCRCLRNPGTYMFVSNRYTNVRWAVEFLTQGYKIILHLVDSLFCSYSYRKLYLRNPETGLFLHVIYCSFTLIVEFLRWWVKTLYQPGGGGRLCPIIGFASPKNFVITPLHNVIPQVKTLLFSIDWCFVLFISHHEIIDMKHNN